MELKYIDNNRYLLSHDHLTAW